MLLTRRMLMAQRSNHISALAIREDALGPMYLDVADSLNNLGAVKILLPNLVEALKS
jgi:hypothetical protein